MHTSKEKLVFLVKIHHVFFSREEDLDSELEKRIRNFRDSEYNKKTWTNRIRIGVCIADSFSSHFLIFHAEHITVLYSQELTYPGLIKDPVSVSRFSHADRVQGGQPGNKLQNR
jgi:hypothetical protein